ncbi:MAG: SMC-Scp complex subunit ScpB [Deltaproteobacteria bacterium]|nr:SMC-Scp complex subunit ScpB [Deltaproteobacteria bacterium]
MTKSLKLIVEALLFSSDKPLTVREIHSCLPDSKPAEIKSALEVLKFEFDGLGRSFQLKEIADGYQFRSRAEFGPYILKMFQASPDRLSKAALETLAIIAYKQPILRHEIERLRGVDAGGILKTLMEKDLIKIMGRKDLPGRPLIYGTTKKFLEVFDLKDISDLPRLKEIKALAADEYSPSPSPQTEGITSESVKMDFEKHEEPEPPPSTSEQGEDIDHDLGPEDEKPEDSTRSGPIQKELSEKDMAQMEAIKEAFIDRKQTYEDKPSLGDPDQEVLQERSESTTED